MFLLVIALIGAGTFFTTGFNLLTDPLCVSADFGGGRVIQVTCRADEFGTVTGGQAGMISILIGMGILILIFWRPIRKLIEQKRNSLSSLNHLKDINFSESIKEVKEISDTKKCPKCAEEIKIEALKCRYCGSEFEPKGLDKFQLSITSFAKKYLNSNYSIQILVVVLVLVVIAMMTFQSISKNRELNALKNIGQICVQSSSGGTDYGCADYPRIKFEICSTSKFIDWYGRLPEIASLTDFNRSSGELSTRCSSEYPYLYSVNYLPDNFPRIGEYEIFGTNYAEFTGGSPLDGGENLVAKVSFKS